MDERRPPLPPPSASSHALNTTSTSVSPSVTTTASATVSAFPSPSAIPSVHPRVHRQVLAYPSAVRPRSRTSIPATTPLSAVSPTPTIQQPRTRMPGHPLTLPLSRAPLQPSPSPLSRPRAPIAKPKKLHREVEQKRRMRMSEQIQHLRTVVCDASRGKTDKVSVLQDAVAYIKRADARIDQLSTALQQRNEECARLRATLATSGHTPSQSWLPDDRPISKPQPSHPSHPPPPPHPPSPPQRSLPSQPSQPSQPSHPAQLSLRDIPHPRVPYRGRKWEMGQPPLVQQPQPMHHQQQPMHQQQHRQQHQHQQHQHQQQHRQQETPQQAQGAQHSLRSRIGGPMALQSLQSHTRLHTGEALGIGQGNTNSHAFLSRGHLHATKALPLQLRRAEDVGVSAQQREQLQRHEDMQQQQQLQQQLQQRQRNEHLQMRSLPKKDEDDGGSFKDDGAPFR